MTRDKPWNYNWNAWYPKASELSKSIDGILEREEPQVRAEIERKVQGFLKESGRGYHLSEALAGMGGITLGILGLYSIISNQRVPTTFSELLYVMGTGALSLVGVAGIIESRRSKRLFKAKAYLERESTEGEAGSNISAETMPSIRVPYHKQ